MQFRVQQARANGRFGAYVGWGAPQPGRYADAALTAAVAASEGLTVQYAWPTRAPVVLPPDLEIGPVAYRERETMLAAIESGADDLSRTHVPLTALLAACSSSSSSSDTPPPQVWDLAELQQRADAAIAAAVAAAAAAGTAAAGAGAAAADAGDAAVSPPPPSPEQECLAVVPDATRPFTLTMRNAADGQDYVVAHYEPGVVSWGSSQKAALLCEAFHARGSKLRMRRTSAPSNEVMAMCGMRVPRSGTSNAGSCLRFGRYVGDEGPEADQFSLSSWPDLARTGGFKAISDLWTAQLPGMVCGLTQAAVDESVRRSGGVVEGARGPPANFPIPSLYGSPFTTLAVTQIYYSLLHVEPGEHPFSYITWLDVLAPGSTLGVGYFWLTHGLAFTPLHGSALYIDVRLVPHCSHTCSVHSAQPHNMARLEGRYGAALFIKPPVIAANSSAWAAFDSFLQLAAAGQVGLPHQLAGGLQAYTPPPELD